MTDLPIKIRGLSEPDKPMLDEHGIIVHQEKAFIASSWAHKERANPAYFWVSKRAFHYQFYLGVVCFLLDARPDLFRIAVNKDNTDQIIGWVCFESPLFYQQYVKEDFRQFDAESLLIMSYRMAEPKEFQELITNERKNQAAKGRVSQSQGGLRTDNQLSAERTEETVGTV